mmetsp:Transcript_23432/g.88987  ORF Transcript_23432/g.88987 Transcript_23432/m.88987 type:complete len:551 (+) Transcript_23432:789-2441(+)
MALASGDHRPPDRCGRRPNHSRGRERLQHRSHLRQGPGARLRLSGHGLRRRRVHLVHGPRTVFRHATGGPSSPACGGRPPGRARQRRASPRSAGRVSRGRRRRCLNLRSLGSSSRGAGPGGIPRPRQQPRQRQRRWRWQQRPGAVRRRPCPGQPKLRRRVVRRGRGTGPRPRPRGRLVRGRPAVKPAVLQRGHERGDVRRPEAGRGGGGAVVRALAPGRGGRARGGARGGHVAPVGGRGRLGLRHRRRPQGAPSLGGGAGGGVGRGASLRSGRHIGRRGEPRRRGAGDRRRRGRGAGRPRRHRAGARRRPRRLLRPCTHGRSGSASRGLPCCTRGRARGSCWSAFKQRRSGARGCCAGPSSGVHPPPQLCQLCRCAFVCVIGQESRVFGPERRRGLTVVARNLVPSSAQAHALLCVPSLCVAWLASLRGDRSPAFLTSSLVPNASAEPARHASCLVGAEAAPGCLLERPHPAHGPSLSKGSRAVPCRNGRAPRPGLTICVPVAPPCVRVCVCSCDFVCLFVAHLKSLEKACRQHFTVPQQRQGCLDAAQH